MINLGLLVKYIPTPSPPAVGVQRRVRMSLNRQVRGCEKSASAGARAGPYTGAPEYLQGHCAGGRFGISVLFRRR